MFVRFITVAIAVLLFALPAHAGLNDRTWSPKKASVLAGVEHIAYSDHRRGGDSKSHLKRGHKKRHYVTDRRGPNSRFKRSYKKLQRFVKRNGPKWRSHKFKKLLRTAYRSGPGKDLKPGKRDHGHAAKKNGKWKKSYANKHKKYKNTDKNRKKHQSISKKKSSKKNSQYNKTSKRGKKNKFAGKSNQYKKANVRYNVPRLKTKNKVRYKAAAFYKKRKASFRPKRGGGGQRFTRKHGKYKFAGRHHKRKCPPSPNKGHVSRGYGKGKLAFKCRGHGYWAAKKKHWHKDRRSRRYGRRDWKVQKYAYMWRAVKRYARGYRRASW